MWFYIPAAIVIALQLCATYWLFFYVSWFAPLALVAMLAAYRAPVPEPRWEFSSSQKVAAKAFH